VLSVRGVEYTIRSWRDARFGAVNLLTGICGNLDQPVTAAGEKVLFLDGEVSNLADLWTEAANGESGESVPSPARACLILYQQHGDDFVKQLNGQFNIVIYDRRKHIVKIFNDRLAYRPLYYRCADGLALFGLEKKALFAALGRTPPLDPMGILEFCTFGHNLDNRTVFSGVDVMSPGTVLEFKDSRISAWRYWRPAYVNPARAVSCAEAARELGRRLCHAVKRQSQGDRGYGIFLSGGLDSRAAAGALARVRRDVASFTYGADDLPDLIYGRQLAAELGFAHHRLRYEDISFADFLPQVVWRTEAAIPFNHTLSIVHHRRIRAEAGVIFNGHFGGVLTGTHLLPGQFLARNARQMAEHILAKRAKLRLFTLRALFRGSFLNDAHPEMVRGIERSLLSFGEDRLPLAYNLWDMTVREPHFTFCSPQVDRYVIEPMTPFTDNDVVEWMLRMPLRYLFGQRVYKRMIVKTFPEIADVPWAKTGRRVPSNFALGMAVQARHFATKRLRGLSARAQPADAGPKLQSLEAYVVGGRISDALPGDLFDRGAVRRVTRAAVDGSGSRMALFMLLTLAECTRLFGTVGLTEPPAETQPIV
jgi:asparagine synthase (glutamine-hydrolysing)